jgi:hypothetical protein
MKEQMFSISIKVLKERSFYISGYPIQFFIKNINMERKNPNLANLGNFFHEKSFAYVKIIILRPKFGINLLIKKVIVSIPLFCNIIVPW